MYQNKKCLLSREITIIEKALLSPDWSLYLCEEERERNKEGGRDEGRGRALTCWIIKRNIHKGHQKLSRKPPNTFLISWECSYFSICRHIHYVHEGGSWEGRTWCKQWFEVVKTVTEFSMVTGDLWAVISQLLYVGNRIITGWKYKASSSICLAYPPSILCLSS